jgi:hypothetical protein
MDVSVLSACFFPDKGPANLLLRSAKRFGIAVDLYGVGKPYGGFMDAKCVQLIEKLKDVKSEYVLYVDARDVVFQLPLSTIFDRYMRISGGSKTVLAGDNVLHPYPRKHKFFTKRAPVGNRYPFPCVGVIMGKRLEIIRELEEMLKLREEMGQYMMKKYFENDQGWWILAITYGRIEAVIDFDCMVSLSLNHQKPDWFMQTRPFVVTAGGICPGAVHFNGSCTKGKIYSDITRGIGLS